MLMTVPPGLLGLPATALLPIFDATWAGLQESGRTITAHSANLSPVTIFALHLKGAIENTAPASGFLSRDPTTAPGYAMFAIYCRYPSTARYRFPRGPAGHRGPRKLAATVAVPGK